MTDLQLEDRWRGISVSDTSRIRSLRINSTCIPELLLAKDFNGNRLLILQVPSGIPVNCPPLELEHLSISWSEATRLILVGLRNQKFSDLFNDFTISLYNRIKAEKNPAEYTKLFISGFYKWSEFFNDVHSFQLSEAEAMGIFGELLMLRDFISRSDSSECDSVLNAWQGPFRNNQDFIFPDYNLEVKTKDIDTDVVRISSEFQLEEEPGKSIKLAIIDLISHQEEGITLEVLTEDIKSLIRNKEGDITIFMKAIRMVKLEGCQAPAFKSRKWKPVGASVYECTSLPDFPRIVSSSIYQGVSRIKYTLNTSFLIDFLIENIKF